MVGALIQPNFIFAKNNQPKIYNHFIRWDISLAEAKNLAKWDVITLDMEVQHTSPDVFQIIRQLNPNIKILVYITSEEITTQQLPDTYLRQQLKNNIKEEWWLKDIHGQKLSQWPETTLLNMNSGWSNYLADFVAKKIIATGYWDGIFFDNIWSDITWINNKIDINNDSVEDTAEKINSLWQQGVKKLLSETRQLVGPAKIIVSNGNGQYYDFINGKMFESFPTPWDGGNWPKVMTNYQNSELASQNPNYNIIQADTNNSGDYKNYARFRYGLTSTLMQGGYYGFDFGTKDHSQLWWYDEYDVNLGSPLGTAKNVLRPRTTNYEPSVWRRDFTNGIVLVNSTNQAQTIDLSDGIYEKIKGNQDPGFNSGEIVNKINLSANDGIILLRKLSLLKNAAFHNGSFVRIFSQTGEVKRSGFYSYDPAFSGNDLILIKDINFDQQEEKIVSHQGQITILDSQGNILIKFYPYSKNYTGAINFAIADLNNDSKMEIVTGAGVGGGPHVRIFNINGQLINSGWFAFDKKNRGGITVAIGNIDGQGEQEIIVGSGRGLAPTVHLYRPNGQFFSAGFLAYDKKFTGGVNVATGDINNDGLDEIITGAGVGGGPHVRIFNSNGSVLNKGFFAFEANKRQGVKIQVIDIDNDGQIEIIGMN